MVCLKEKKKVGVERRSVAQSSHGAYCPQPVTQNILSYPWPTRPQGSLAEAPTVQDCSQSWLPLPHGLLQAPRRISESEPGAGPPGTPAQPLTAVPCSLRSSLTSGRGKRFMLSQLTPVHSSSQVVLFLDQCVIYVRRAHLTPGEISGGRKECVCVKPGTGVGLGPVVLCLFS